jgi:5'-nucleotidase/UDP-sugar diphosphatase
MKKSILFIGGLLIFFLLCPEVLSQTTEIRILHLNDFHGFAEPYRPFGSSELLGGIAYLAAKAKELRKEKPTLLLAAGDMIQGHNWANLSQGESVIELMNAMGFDAMVVGNHEFDFGSEALKKRIAEARFPILGANVEGLQALKPFIVKELSGIKVAIVGLVTSETPISTHPRNVAGFRFLPVEEVSARYIQELKGRADLILFLTHLGHAADRILAEKVEGIDVIVGGHSHTKVAKPVRLGQTLIVQAWEHGKALGVLDLKIQDGKIAGFDGHLEEIRPKAGGEDPTIQAIVEKYRKRAEAVLETPIGEAEVDLDGENVRRRETNLGNLIADIVRAACKAEAAIINGGGIRMSIAKGTIRVKDIHSVLPFDNYIVAIGLTGRQIVEALEHGVSGLEENEGRFPQVSGLSFRYSPSEKKGRRIKEVQIAGQPLDPNREYAVATHDFLAAGGDGYKAFGEAIRSSRDFETIGGLMKGEKILSSDSGRWLRDVVVEYIRGQGRIAPKVEGRIQEVPGDGRMGQ